MKDQDMGIIHQEVKLSTILNEWMKDFKPREGVEILEAKVAACDLSRDTVVFAISWKRNDG
jgi:hypothetical protein